MKPKQTIKLLLPASPWQPLHFLLLYLVISKSPGIKYRGIKKLKKMETISRFIKARKPQKIAYARKRLQTARNHKIIRVRKKGLWWEGFAKKVGYEPGVKERTSYG